MFSQSVNINLTLGTILDENFSYKETEPLTSVSLAWQCLVFTAAGINLLLLCAPIANGLPHTESGITDFY